MIETLYFSCYSAYLLGDLNKTQLYYSMLRDEFKTSGNISILKNYQLTELKKIKTALDSGNISRNTWLDTITTQEPPQTHVSMSQDDLVRKIHFEGLEQLKALLGTDLWLYNLEHPCGSYGAVDMVYMSNDTVYPVEVKKNRAEHDLIGQIIKYDLFHKLQLNLKYYEHVQSVTICGNYQPFVINELKQMNIIPITYSILENKIFLKKI